MSTTRPTSDGYDTKAGGTKERDGNIVRNKDERRKGKLSSISSNRKDSFLTADSKRDSKDAVTGVRSTRNAAASAPSKRVASGGAQPRKQPLHPQPWSSSDCQGYWYIYAPHWEAKTKGLIVAIETTFVKRSTAYSWELPEWEKREVPPGFEMRISGPPRDVIDPREKNRHKWTHLHRQVHLGDYERCKAELSEAKERLEKSEKRLQREEADVKAFARATKDLALAKAEFQKEMDMRKRLGLPMDVDPFDESFPTGPPSSAEALLAPALPPSPPKTKSVSDEAPPKTKTMVPVPETKKTTTTTTRHFIARGTVQGVMFRQTLIRAALKRKLQAGATNRKDGSVAISLRGREVDVEALAKDMRSCELNSWGASVASLDTTSDGIPVHQVTTENVDTFAWDPTVKMYL
eukprot:g2916.t1